MPTTQARAYNADWVPYLDPPEKPAAVCLVDSGVNVTPDTPEDSPAGPIVKRLALDGGPGTAAGSSWEALHGTRMAFVGAAPVNGWGAVGIWPGARIISIRAMPVGESTFPFDSYSRALDICNKQPERVVAANLSLDCSCAPTSQEISRLANQVTRAHANEESVIAAVGNQAAAVGSPASQAGVFGVAAGDVGGTLCPFSNRGDGVDLIAAGCGSDLADPMSGANWSSYASGTSGAAITASIALALLRSYRPDLSRATAEALLQSSGRATAYGPALDLEALFRAAELGRIVDAAKARMPVPSEPSPVSRPFDSDQRGAANPSGSDGQRGFGSQSKVKSEPPRPVLRSVRVGLKRAVVVVRNRPRGFTLVVVLQRRRTEFGYTSVSRIERRANRATIALPPHRSWHARVRIQLIAQQHGRARAVSSPVYYSIRK